jgi:hypothetical protein
VRITSILRAYLLLGLFGVTLWAVPTVPDNGSGTAALPIRLPYVNEVATPFMIVNGLPPGTTIRLDAVFTPPTSSTEVPGGGLGGTRADGTNMNMNVNMTGSGTLAGFSRSAVIPIPTWQQDNALRVNFAPVQSFNTDLASMQGQMLPGDPDFDLLRITAGTNFGLPSPGHTTLTQSGGNWGVDSFFDVTYRIDFVGHPGGALSGMSGSTTGTAHISVVPEPAALSLGLAAALICLRRRR